MGTVIKAAAVLLGMTPTLASAKDAYVCVEDYAAGIQRDNGKDRMGPAATKKMTIVLDGNKATVKYSSQFGPVVEEFECKPAFGVDRELLQCAENSYFMMFDIRSLVFNRAQIFLNTRTSDQDPLTVSRGTCQKF